MSHTTYWTGAHNCNWSDPRNWTAGVPDVASHVVITGNLEPGSEIHMGGRSIEIAQLTVDRRITVPLPWRSRLRRWLRRKLRKLFSAPWFCPKLAPLLIRRNSGQYEGSVIDLDGIVFEVYEAIGHAILHLPSVSRGEF